MANFQYQRASDRLTTGSWSIPTGTVRTGYGLTNLDDRDPSTPLWITGTSLRIVKDFGAAQRIDEVNIYAHTFVNAANLRFQMHTADSWGTPDVDLGITIPTAYLDGFSYNLRVDVATLVPVAANRTKRYVSIANLSANTVTCAIGEMWLSATQRSLVRNVRVRGAAQAVEHGATKSMSKRGVSTVYDMGFKHRGFIGTVMATQSDLEDVLVWREDSKSIVSPVVFVLNPGSSRNRHAEPVLVRVSSPVYAPTYEEPELIPVTLEFEELGRGELLGA